MNSIKLSLLTFFLGILMFPAFGQSTNSKEIKVNEQRIESRIFELSEFGKDQNGKAYRVAFSEGDIKARNWFIDLMKKAGLEVKIDEVGNIEKLNISFENFANEKISSYISDNSEE